MIITKLRLQEEHPMSSAGGSWPLPVCDLVVDPSAGENGYILEDSQGLDPPDFVEIVEGYDVAGIPIMSNVPQKRQIVLKIGLSPRLGQSFSSLRDALYRFISRNVYIKFMNDALVTAQTTGHVSKCETVSFTAQPQITMTIDCVDGELSAPYSFAIPLTTLVGTTGIAINYEEGTAPTGLDLQFIITATADGFNISNYVQTWYNGVSALNQFGISYEFLVGDVITISTQPRNRSLSVVRAGVKKDLAGYINQGAVWPRLYPGVNIFDWTFASSWMTWNSASYVPRYWGV